MEPRRSLRVSVKLHDIPLKVELPEKRLSIQEIKKEVDVRKPRKSRKSSVQSSPKVSKKEPEESAEDTDGDENEENQNGLSEYEKQIQQNVEERKKMFHMLIGSAKDDFLKSVSPSPKEQTATATPRGLKRKKIENSEPQPLRMSLRSSKQPLEYSIGYYGEDKPSTPGTVKANKNGPLSLSETVNDQDSEEDSAKFIQDLIPLLEKEGELEKLPADLQDFMKLMKSFSICENGVAKVAKQRIYSLAWHPNPSKLLIATGDRDGGVGFWDIDQLEDKHQGVRAFQVHKMPINCITFDRYNPTRLLTTSYDGYVRCLDFHTNNFNELYAKGRSKDSWTAYHAQKDPSTLVVSQSDGIVAIVDMRTSPGTVQNTITCFENSARSVSLHPQDENLFMVCNRYGEAGIFDLRYTSTKEDELAPPVVSFPKASKGIHGAFFSPLTGKYVLNTCTDNTLKLYDVQGNTEANCIKSIDHNNFTGRWLTPFKAVWHPQREDVFVVGSMEQPRRVELFGAPDGQLLHTFCGEFLTSVACVNAFHPSVPIFAGGNASGRVHIFRP